MAGIVVGSLAAWIGAKDIRLFALEEDMRQVEILLEVQEQTLVWVQEAAPMLELAYEQHQAVAEEVSVYQGSS
jgi:hypothetical protein